MTTNVSLLKVRDFKSVYFMELLGQSTNIVHSYSTTRESEQQQPCDNWRRRFTKSNFLNLTVFSYLSLQKVVFDIRPLSKKIKEILVNSEIANENKTLIWKVDAVGKCLLHENRLQAEIEKFRVVLELVSEVYFDLTYLGFDG